ncbi:MAG: hypothetical protein JNN11_00165 [Candidatus Doudnabacteria bacterium]|nr:hypothetical protein [Candidatus Doudnabacteria bacterium]
MILLYVQNKFMGEGGEMISLFAIWLASGLCFGQGWVEERVHISSHSLKSRLAGIYTSALTPKTGTFVWFQADKEYSQSYAGLTYLPTEWLQVAAGAGLEQNSDPLRIGGFAAVNRKGGKGLLILETGGSGFFWRVEAGYPLGKGFGLGVLSQVNKGSGLRVEYRLKKMPLVLWSDFFCTKKLIGVMGVRWIFR